jgi:hypothetical protein
MPLLTETERSITAEKNLINDPATYSITNQTSLVTVKDYGNITLAEAGLVIFKYVLRQETTALTKVYSRLEIGGIPIQGDRISNNANSEEIIGGLCWLAAGTYNVTIKGCTSSTNTLKIREFQIGFVKFNDSVGHALAAYSSGIALTVPARTTPAGTLNQAVFAVMAEAYTSGDVTNFEDAGETLTNGVGITVDGVRVNWSQKQQDVESKQAAHGKCFYPCSVGSSHTIAIVKENAGTVVNISICACPWLLGGPVHNPVTLSFSQGSTLYVAFEPLFVDESKFAGVGKMRAVSHATTTDYYDSTTGTGIIAYSYVFETVDQSIGFACSGLGGCIGIVGADLR